MSRNLYPTVPFSGNGRNLDDEFVIRKKPALFAPTAVSTVPFSGRLRRLDGSTDERRNWTGLVYQPTGQEIMMRILCGVVTALVFFGLFVAVFGMYDATTDCQGKPKYVLNGRKVFMALVVSFLGFGAGIWFIMMFQSKK